MTVRFGDFELVPGARQLRRLGVEVHLTPKAFDLLVALVEYRPNALTKAQLHELLWPETFVAESNLAALVNELRRALNDSASGSRLIRTVPRFGYAFCGDTIGGTPLRSGQQLSCWLILENARIELAPGANLIGRDPRARVWIDLPTVSKRHARITIESDEVSLEDLQSKNGTYLRGQRIGTPTRLHDRDPILFGSVPVTFRSWQARQDADTQTSE